MRIQPRFPGADLERRKFLDFLQGQARQGDLTAAELRADLFCLSGRTVGHLDLELRSLSNQSRERGWRWAGAGLAASVAGALAGHWWAGWPGALGGALLGLPAAWPARRDLQAAQDLLVTNWQMRHHAQAVLEGKA